MACNLQALYSVVCQRFGHALWNKELSGMAILFVEKEYFDNEWAAKEA